MKDELYFLDIYAGILKMSGEFERGGKTKLSCDFSNPKLVKLKERYGLEKIAGNESDFSRAVNVMTFLSKNIFHASDYDNIVPSDSLSLLDYSFKKGQDFGLNCKAISVILTECLLSLGIEARTVYIMPLSPYDMDNHVVTHVYISELSKWVMLDATFNCYCMDEDGTPLGLLEIREHISERRELAFNEQINYNGLKKLDYGKRKIAIEPFYCEYLAKNLYYFETFTRSCYGVDRSNGTVSALMPKGYDAKKSRLNNIEYRILESEDDEEKGKLIEQYQKLKAGDLALRRRIPLSPESFLAHNENN